ncbi:CHAT domain-containing protein [Hoeflea marina]|uniref:CHAT domain-containing protein n=1 Tax=Hoeflea marina TaxID=274592 RepID=A0A317PPH8_9HYPH|nr:CHAT domain-containing protein [Hoeflea marina]PWW01460.1 CHAT domain-containing protein [Hoeflea marina]
MATATGLARNVGVPLAKVGEFYAANGAVSALPPQVLVSRRPETSDLGSGAWLIRDHAITVMPTVSGLSMLRTQAAGARALLVSHWVVDDAATAALMSRLFGAAARPGTRPSQALQLSMLSLIDDPDNPDWKDPAYWAPFVLVGEPL